ncbi:MAG: galactose-1-phosphate uridylyltransferase [Candidatus Thorarchaeota archaeon]
MSEIRWNSMLGEWIIIAPKRGDRHYQENDDSCPLCPGHEETEGDWSVLTLDSKFPALNPEEGHSDLSDEIVIGVPGYGFCKLIVQSSNHNEQIEDMDESHLTKVLTEYISVFKELSSKKGIEYVMIFENRGKVQGVSQEHSHAQAYGLPFIPPKMRKEISQVKKYYSVYETCLICESIENEFKTRERVVKESENYVSIVPYGARLPYETHIYPKKHVPSLIELESSLPELGMMIKDTVTRFSKIFEETVYVMALHSSPVKGKHDYWHFHIEFYPPWGDTAHGRQLAGIETGAGVFTNDSLPEDKAKELREAL